MGNFTLLPLKFPPIKLRAPGSPKFLVLDTALPGDISARSAFQTNFVQNIAV